MQIQLPSISLPNEAHSYFIYTTLSDMHIHKNAGMFWEPGAYAGVLTLCLALNFNNLNYYWEQHRFKLLIVIIALITSQSTTGYIVGALIISAYFIQSNKMSAYLFTLPLLFFIGLYLYENNPFLKDKIEFQLKKTEDQEVGEFSNSRFGSVVFDWHYIKKHPLLGNGLLEETRYADHQKLFVDGDMNVIKSGNSFSHYIASLGIFFVLGYFYLLKNAIFSLGKVFTILILATVFLNLQGEQWFNFPLYLGLLFLRRK